MENSLFGLVLAGGKSERMGRDKGLLDYRGKPHRFYLSDLLGAHCERVFISVNSSQMQMQAERYDYIVDDPAFANNGPIGALLTANQLHPNHAWLVVSCDLPFCDEACIQTLLQRRDTAQPATAFFNRDNERPEPLLTIYEASFVAELPSHFANGERSLMRLLHKHGVHLIHEFNRRWIFSADTPEAFESAKGDLNF